MILKKKNRGYELEREQDGGLWEGLEGGKRKQKCDDIVISKLAKIKTPGPNTFPTAETIVTV